MNLLEPWVLLRLVAGLVACAFFARGAWTAQKVLRHFDVRERTEGQLALEKQMELGAAFVRIGAVVQVLSLVLSVLGADRMSRDVRGAMCAYGVFGANEWGFPALFVTTGVALLAGVLTQIYAFDGRVRALDLARPLAILTLGMFPLSLIDLGTVFRFLGKLDLSVVASCCSVRLDAAVSSSDGHATFGSLVRNVVTVLAVTSTLFAIGLAWTASRAPTKSRVTLAGAASLLALPAVVAATVLEVAPHVFEVPQHVCPFCLLRSDVLAIGYPLYGAIFLAVVWAVGAASSALLSRSPATRSALPSFAKPRLRRGAVAWAIALVLGIAPVVRYAVVSGGVSLFQDSPQTFPAP